MNWPFALAGVIGAVAFVTHTFVGTRYAIPPLLAEAKLPAATRGLNYLCWHAATMILFVIGAVALAGAGGWIAVDAVAVAGVIAACIATVSVIATRKVGIAPLRFPASYLLGAMALSVAAGFVFP